MISKPAYYQLDYDDMKFYTFTIRSHDEVEKLLKREELKQKAKRVLFTVLFWAFIIAMPFIGSLDAF